MKNKILKTVLSIAAAARFWFGLWFVLAKKTGSELLLPSPVAVFRRFFELLGEKELYNAAGKTILRIFTGFVAGTAAGTLLAVITARGGIASAVLSPAGKVIKATPVASFIVLALLWLQSDRIPSFIVFLMVTPIIWDALATAIRSTDRELLEMARTYRFGIVKTVWRVYLPSVFPAYLSALTTALGLGWKAGIAAEVLCLPKLSIGRSLYYSKIYLETVDLFAWTMLVILLSVIMEALLKLAVRKAVKRK